SFPTLDEVVRTHIERALETTGGRVYGEGGAAELLGLKPTTLQSRMAKLGISRVAQR
ncbi:MAG: helix-turn-helix domain-containing protein, partial [Spirochaetota bacterium]